MSMTPLRSTWFVAVAAIGSTLPAQDDAALRARGKAYVDSLCAPRFSGRGYVNDGGKLAADWIAAQYQRIGLQTVEKVTGQGPSTFYESFTFDVNTFPDSCIVRIDSGLFEPGVDFLVDPSSGKAQGRFDIVHLTPADLLTPERRAMTMGVVSGRAVMLDLPATDNKDSLALHREWERELMHYGPVLKRAQGKLTWSVAGEARPFPLIELSRETWPDSAHVLDINVRNKMIRQHRARNVLGVAPAKGGSKKWVILSAHYDHLGLMGPDALFPGANDNASGVAMLLTLAEHFTQHPGRYNILFIAFAGEEAGLQGSTWCVQDRPLGTDWSMVRLMINMDILGTGDDGVMVVNATEQQAVYDQLVAMNTRSQRLPAINKRGPACNSDHCPFVQRGVPAVFLYTMGGIAAYHDVLDRPETLPLTEFPDIHHTLVDLVNGLK